MTDFAKAREAAAYALRAVEWENAPGIIPPIDELEMPYWLKSIDAALSAFSAAGWELVQKGDGLVRVPIEVENACLNWLANRIQGNSHGEDVELGRLMSGLQTYIQAVADGTSK